MLNILLTFYFKYLGELGSKSLGNLFKFIQEGTSGTGVKHRLECSESHSFDTT